MDGSGDLDCREFEAAVTNLATSDWSEAYDGERGKAYYFNRQTNETRWHRPDSEAAVSEFMQANGLVLQPLIKPPALETLREPGAPSGSGRARTETTHNPMSMSGGGGTFDVETPEPTPRRRSRTAAGVLGQSAPKVAPRPAPRRAAVPARQARPLPSLPTRAAPTHGVPIRHASASRTPRRARAPTTHGGSDKTSI